VARKVGEESRIADDHLTTALLDILIGDLGRRKLGVVLLLVGLAVATVGNVWGYA
jgi:hypothetical protein